MTMRKISILAAVAAFAASPAMAAGEGRVVANGGIVFAGGASEATIGAEAGYDFDLGDKAFVGVAGGVKKILADGSDAFFEVVGRVGAKLGDKTKIYALGGLAFCCGSSDGFAGVGLQRNFGNLLLGNIEYRRIIGSGTDLNFVTVGLGVRF